VGRFNFKNNEREEIGQGVRIFITELRERQG
jgi:hypothetical protein